MDISPKMSIYYDNHKNEKKLIKRCAEMNNQNKLHLRQDTSFLEYKPLNILDRKPEEYFIALWKILL